MFYTYGCLRDWHRFNEANEHTSATSFQCINECQYYFMFSVNKKIRYKKRHKILC